MASSDYVTTNEYVPKSVSKSPNGKSVTPTTALDSTLLSDVNHSLLRKRHAYQRLNDSIKAKSNPPFKYGSAGKLTVLTSSVSKDDARILRGYIRRSGPSGVDPTDGYRLYFMFNPQTIQRSYVAYLEQQALDPFNTIYGSNNLVAPPGILDFSFELMFDRQVENANGDMPRGVLEDFDYFDLVVRGVVPEPGAPQIQDNGIMMVNPRNITVVFSPQLSVQGRPNSASVSYEKFDHNMRPIRMTIRLSMKAFYFGPVRPDFTFESTQSNAAYKATIPYDESIKATATVQEIKAKQHQRFNFDVNTGGTRTPVASAEGGRAGGGSGVDQSLQVIDDISSLSNQQIRLRALQQAQSLEGRGVQYVTGGRGGESGVDCSGLVQWAYQSIGAYDAVGYGQTSSLINYARQHGTLVAEGPFNGGLTDDQVRSAQKGDLLVSEYNNGGISDHVLFFIEMVGDSSAKVFESIPQTGPHTATYPINGPAYALGNYDYIIRPAIAGRDTFGNP